MPSVVMLLAWADVEAWRRGWTAFNQDARFRAACERQRAELGATRFGDSDSLLLEPAPYALPFASLPATLPE